MITFEFHVIRNARDKYQLDENLFTITGDLVIANFRQARLLAEKINTKRKAEKKFDQLTSAGQLNALGLIHEIFHFIIRIYEEKENPGVLSRGIEHLQSQLGENNFKEICLEFTKDFPPLDVYKGKIKPEEYLEGRTDNKSNREIIFEELLLLHLTNINPAVKNLDELYTDKKLSEGTKYQSLLNESEKFFDKEKLFSPENVTLISFLKKPIHSNPHSLEEQLDFILRKWRIFIFDKFGDRILRSKDLILEELKLFLQFGGGKPTPPVPIYDDEYLRMLRAKLARGESLTDDERRFYYSEYEKFTADIEWMPKVVMIAKNTFVWLDQLSKKYGRSITTLDQIPDEELDLLAKWNFTSLWLIGIWERSNASKKIKQLTGNSEAAPSAYSLFDYIIAGELGGEDAFQNLRSRAGQRGIRLASDMVPNHTGIYSKWIVEKPNYFLQSDYTPYPGYSFNGPNLSDDSRVEVRIEDKYYSREDAAVVFQRRDSFTGEVKYIYHGNDGTHMPWNDTAQLNLLDPEVRESLIQTIMHVAQKFPIIRFDAAMTLAKKHYQRLWFPQPGTGGAIPSRSDYSMTREAFDEAMPNEFWREVVDRINSEMPNTLLLAEAFWLMEGYFVRTLGMHRVYNSAFMHMFMKEENSKYRELIKNTLEFNPEILKRYVNFMSNPDEETAVNQFGKGDKYFGVAVMMVTLPGLPMFAHGQIEGLSEKYGMEYKRSYYNEFPDEYLVRRHEAEIFHLIQKRNLFSQVENFQFYDFNDEFGNINENVFAFSNKSGNEKVLVLYNNAYERCSGTINYSVSKVDREGAKDHKVKKLAEALDFNYHYKNYYSFKEHRTNLEYLISSRDAFENGFSINLNGFEYKIFLEFNEIYDELGEYEKLNNLLKGNGVVSIQNALEELRLSPLHESLINLFSHDFFDEMYKSCISVEGISKDFSISNLQSEKYKIFLNEFSKAAKLSNNSSEIIETFKNNILEIKSFVANLNESIKGSNLKHPDYIERFISVFHDSQNFNAKIFFIYLTLKEVFGKNGIQIEMFDKLYFTKPLFEVFKSSNQNIEKIYQSIGLIKALISKNDFIIKELAKRKADSLKFITDLISGKEACDYILLNEFEGTIYFNKERFEDLLDWLFVSMNVFGKNYSKLSLSASKSFSFFEKIKASSGKANYKLAALKTLLSEKPKEKKVSPKKSAIKKKRK
ncbi:MAG: alpha-amylase family glycosyl hydrolase [Bacteroidetes bacterium]|nr:alpha-amylase family glycosyl hydrolase [Bacteroidota bacterium]